MTDPPRRVVIGLGNPFRRDDGVGHAVVAALRDRGLEGAGVGLVALDGEPARLLDAWRDAGLVVVVDAVRGVGPAGCLHQRELRPVGGRSPALERAISGHGEGLPAALGLGAALGWLPDRLVVVGVEAGDLGHGPGLSPAVGAAVAPVVAMVEDLVTS